MQIAGGYQIPWMWQFNTPSGTTSSGQATQSEGGSAASPTDSTGASGVDGAVQQFDTMMQAMILQLQADAGTNGSGSGNASAQSSTDPATDTAGTTSAGAGQTTASTNATTASDANTGWNGQVDGHHHGHHHHHDDGANSQSQSLSSADLTTLQNDANSLVSALFGVLQSSNTTAGSGAATASAATDAASGTMATAASTGTSAADASTTSSTTDAPGAAPWQNIASTFAQDLLNAVQTYEAQNKSATAANVNQAASTVA